MRLSYYLNKKNKNRFYINYLMQKAGNDNPKLQQDINIILNKLEKILK
jgi:hypothetical protein